MIIDLVIGSNRPLCDHDATLYHYLILIRMLCGNTLGRISCMMLMILIKWHILWWIKCATITQVLVTYKGFTFIYIYWYSEPSFFVFLVIFVQIITSYVLIICTSKKKPNRINMLVTKPPNVPYKAWKDC